MKVEIPHERINLWLLCLLLIVFPFHVKASNIILITFGGHWLFWAINNPSAFRLKDKRVWLMLVPYVLCAASLLYTANVKEGVFILDKKIALFIFPFCLGTMPKMPGRFVDRIMLVATGSIILALLICYGITTYNVTNGLPGGFFWKDFTLPLNEFHPTYLSLYINLLIAFIAFRFFSQEANTIAAKILSGLVLVLLFVSQVLLSSKIQLVCGAFIFLLMLVQISRSVNPKVVLSLLIILVVALIILLRSSYTWERFMHINTLQYKLDAPPETYNEFTIRLAIMDCASEIIREHPLFGTGMGDVNDDLDIVYRKTDFKFGYLDKLNPHNEYLGQLLGLGFVGLSVFVCILGVLLVVAFKRMDTVFIIFVILVILSFAFESMLERQKGIFVFSLFSALFLFHSEGKAQVKAPDHV